MSRLGWDGLGCTAQGCCCMHGATTQLLACAQTGADSPPGRLQLITRTAPVPPLPPAGAYNAALEFASGAKDKSQAARAVALCYMGLKELDRCAAGARGPGLGSALPGMH